MGCGGSFESLERVPSRALSKTKTEEKQKREGKSKLYSVRACRSSKRYRCLGIFVGFAAETTGWLVLVLRTSLFIFYLLARLVILSQRVPAELSDEYLIVSPARASLPSIGLPTY